MLRSFALTGIPDEDEALRPEIRAFLATAVPGISADLRARSWMGYDPAFSRALAERGWVGMTLPTQYGGQGRSYFARFVVVEELLAAGAPVGAHWVAERQSGPVILHYGTEEQRQYYLPRICRGEAFFCIGMSEPNAGSDLASIKTRATRSDGGWRLNGAKIWTTYAQGAHYMIALVRTSGTADDRHHGLSQVIVDLSLPGVTVKPIVDLAGDSHFCEVHFDDVHLAAEALIGVEGEGWAQCMAELSLERSGPERLYSSILVLDLWLDHLRAGERRDERTLALVGTLVSQLAVLRALSLALTGQLVRGERPEAAAALYKDLATAFEQAVPALISDAVAAQPEVVPPVQLARALAYTTMMAPAYSLRGGTREILRGMVARGLGLR
jgi:alkylation response protein AidB-like acyl-CoA dehydrogenase